MKTIYKEVIIENKRSSCYELLCWLNFQNMGFFMFFVSLLVFAWWCAMWKKWAEVHTSRATLLFNVIIFWRARFAGHRCCLNFPFIVSLSAFTLFSVFHSWFEVQASECGVNQHLLCCFDVSLSNMLISDILVFEVILVWLGLAIHRVYMARGSSGWRETLLPGTTFST